MTPRRAATATSTRWPKIFLGFIADDDRVIRGSTLFSLPASPARSTGAQWTITALIVLQTWLSPLQGYLVERQSKPPIGLAGYCSGLG